MVPLLALLAYGGVAALASVRASAPDPTATDDAPVVGARTERLAVEVAAGPEVAARVVLDALLVVPDGVDADRPAPAVILLHGFASDRRSQDARAADLAADGYVVLVPSARGFGDSGGTISLADPDREGRDVVALIDLLATRSEVVRDGPGDPRLALIGTSYGGGIALVAAALDPRVDALVAIAAWHDLAESLAPDGAGPAGRGPLKVGWTSRLFSARTVLATGDGLGAAAGVAAPAGHDPRDDVGLARCGRFSPEVCALAERAAVDGALDVEARRSLARASISHLGAPRAPTLLVHGRGDTLFPVGQAFANARALTAAGTPVRLRLIAGGHGATGPAAASGGIAGEVDAWLAGWLRGDGVAPPANSADTGGAAAPPSGVAVHDAAGRAGTLPLPPLVVERVLAPASDGSLGEPAEVPGGVAAVALVAPAGGQPAALTTLPGIGAIDGLGLLGAGDVAGQHVAFTSAPLEDDVLLAGTADLELGVAASTGAARLFVRLTEVDPGARTELIAAQVVPVDLRAVSVDPDAPTRVRISMPESVHLIDRGNRLRLTVATTDQAFENLRAPDVVLVDLRDARLTLRSASSANDVVASRPVLDLVRDAPVVAGVALAAVAVPALVGAVARLRGRRRPPLAPRAERLALAAGGPPPVVVRGLEKRYPDGTRAVDGLDLTVEAGQVVGLLGPNGAGKTTTLRMLLGLVAPTAGTIELFGQRVRPGHPVLERVGSLVEGPGLSPDLSGRDNLELHWRAGGRPLVEAELDWALAVADLGEDVDRPVRSYSHGMAQRLAIAQAMLGRPELLVLDEPTDGLDPEQIRAMRRLLVRLGAEGHTVLVSSHLLAEVEQTCTHAVVVLGGRVVASGPVSELGERARTLVVEVDDRERARDLVVAALGQDAVALEGSGIIVTLPEPERAADVVSLLVVAGLRVSSASRRGRLEDAFLQLTAHGVGLEASVPAADGSGGRG
ncbi:MAG: hypothetical protein RLZZ272_1039 [Actinomycetota bacterium]